MPNSVSESRVYLEKGGFLGYERDMYIFVNGIIEKEGFLLDKTNLGSPPFQVRLVKIIPACRNTAELDRWSLIFLFSLIGFSIFFLRFGALLGSMSVRGRRLSMSTDWATAITFQSLYECNLLSSH